MFHSNSQTKPKPGKGSNESIPSNKVLQFKAEAVGAWASGGNTVIGGYGAAGAGTQTAGLIFGRVGEAVGGTPVHGATEEYNG